MDQTPENHDDSRPSNRGGRPSKWNERMIEEAYLYCLEHHGTDQDLANYLGIGLSAFYDYQVKHPEFSEAIKSGRKRWRQNGCGNAVRSLYQKLERQFVRVPRVKEKWSRDDEGNMVLVDRTVTMETHIYEPDQRAIEFVLCNQDSENWKRAAEVLPHEEVIDATEHVRKALKEFDEMHRTVIGAEQT